MKILHAVPGWPPESAGRTETHVRDLARAQAAAGHEVLVAAGSASDRFEGGFRRQTRESGGVDVYRISRRDPFGGRWDHGSSPTVELAFGALLDEQRPDLVHVHGWRRLTSALVHRAARAGIPSVVSLHDAASVCPRGDRRHPEDPLCERPSSVASCLGCVPREAWAPDALVAEQLERYAYDVLSEVEDAAALVVPSAAHAALLSRFGGLAPERFEVVPEPDTAAAARGRERDERAPWTPDGGRPLRLLAWGPLEPGSGVHDLLEAAALLDEPAAVEIHLCGTSDDAAYDASLEDLGRDLALRRRSGDGPRDLAAAAADLAVRPALDHDPGGTSVDPALALGLPVLVSDRGGLAERAGGAARSFPAGRPRALAALLREVLAGEPALAELRAALPPPPSLEDHRRALEEVYARAVERGPERSAPAEDAEDRKRWERLCGLLEVQARTRTGLHDAAEREVAGLRQDVSDVFAETQEVRAQLAGRTAELRALEARIAELESERAAQVGALESHLAEERADHAARVEDKARHVQDLEQRIEEVHRLRAEEITDLERRTREALRDARDREERLWAEVAHRDHRLRKLGRENQLALPLVLPVRGLLWLWDRFERLVSPSPPDADAPDADAPDEGTGDAADDGERTERA